MNRYFTNMDHANLIYFQFPKILMYGEKYKKMSGDGKLLYMLTLDLIKLSMKKGWKDKNGYYYIKMSLETIQDRMNCGRDKAVKLKKELVKFDLLQEKRIGQGKSNRLYVLQLEYSDADIYKANNDHEDIENDEEKNTQSPYTRNQETPETLGGEEKSEKQTSRSRKSRPLEVGKTDTIKNELIKNELIKNENYLSIYNEKIKKLAFPPCIKNVLLKQIDRLIDYNFDLDDIELNYKANQGQLTENQYAHMLSVAITEITKPIQKSTANFLTTSVQRYLDYMKEHTNKTHASAKQHVRKEPLPDWVNEVAAHKNNNENGVMQMDLEAEKARLDQMISEFNLSIRQQ